MDPMNHDWVLANHHAQPGRRESILEKNLKLAAERAGMGKNRLAHLIYDPAVAGRRREGATGPVTRRRHSDKDERMRASRRGSEARSQ